jgi:hypothetical protein
MIGDSPLFFCFAPHDSNGDELVIIVLHQMTTCSLIFGSVSRLRLAVELGFVLDPKSYWCQLNAGAYAGIEALVELHEQHHMPYTEDVSRGAAESGSFSKMQWLLDEQQCPEPDNLDCFAVYAPTLDMLKWLKQRGRVFTADTCSAAAISTRAGTVLQYLHSEGAPFDANTMFTAICYQELPLMQWLYEHGCPLSERAALASYEDVQLLSWLHSQGCPCNYHELCLRAAEGGYIDTLQWVKDTGVVVDWSDAVLSQYLNTAAACGQLNTAKVRNSTEYADCYGLIAVQVCKHLRA